jgi:hypothetical protein
MPLDHERENATRYPSSRHAYADIATVWAAAGSMASDAPSCHPLTRVGIFGYDNDL